MGPDHLRVSPKFVALVQVFEGRAVEFAGAVIILPRSQIRAPNRIHIHLAHVSYRDHLPTAVVVDVGARY